MAGTTTIGRAHAAKLGTTDGRGSAIMEMDYTKMKTYPDKLKIVGRGANEVDHSQSSDRVVDRRQEFRKKWEAIQMESLVDSMHRLLFKTPPSKSTK